MTTDSSAARDRLTFCTAGPKRDLAQIRTLASSVRQYHPGARFCALILDQPDGYFRPEGEPFPVLTTDDLYDGGSPSYRFRFTADELRHAVKPALMTYLFRRSGARTVVYLDPELRLVQNLRTLAGLLDRHPIVTTFFLDPPDNSVFARQPAPPAGGFPPPAIAPGVENPPFIALNRGPTADSFLTDWRGQIEGVTKPGQQDPFTDQKWIDPLSGCLRRFARLSSDWPYSWGVFDNGVAVGDFVRRCYNKLGAAAAEYGDPFQTAGPNSFYNWLTSFSGSNLPPLVQTIYEDRKDLHYHFPNIAGADRTGYLEWAANWAAHNHLLDPALLLPVRAALGLPVPAAGKGRWTTDSYRPPNKSFGVNVVGFLRSEKGLGEACRATIRAIRQVDIPYALNNWEDGGSINGDTSLTGLIRENPYPINLVHMNAHECSYIARDTPWYYQGRYNIGFWNWELEWFPEQWRDSFNYFDEIWAPSAFTQASLARVSPVPVHRIPFSITAPPLLPGAPGRDRFGLPKDTFVFLFSFDFHSYFARKNPLAVIEAFHRAFPTRRDVVLALKPLRCDAAPKEFAEVLIACRGRPNIRILREVLSRDDLVALVRATDAYVSLHRSEGFGLPLAEAMSLGKPVIATNYSANVDYLNETNGFPVRYKMIAIDQDYGPYRRGAEWADADVDHAAEQMRRVVEYPEQTARIAARARDDTAKNLSPAAVGRMILARLNAIQYSGRVAA
ncbi:glycosyltransferase family 4 protein [Fimbriiglobus ruber]|uniref:Glycosyltransferase n=1 Tax=Fimbriiglobus ruber TaxID=1908690 RepID=A0A225DWH7_9BACT|nr:glycosyltransferase family 4 protein [Fimbriiglobus ruber]OWK43924.1 Glycosyltransferase [Fimbriiglobus ruber]